MRSILSLPLLVLAVVANSQGQQLSPRAPIRGGCGTKATPELLKIASDFALEDAAEFPSLSSSGTGLSSNASSLARLTTTSRWPTWKPKKGLNIKTWFHVVAGSRNASEGWIPEKMLKDQLDVINSDYAPHKIHFDLQGVTRTINANWTYDGNEFEMKKALRKGDYKTLNIYFQVFLDGGSPGSFGYAKFPTTTPRGSRNFTIDGVSIAMDTLPGGAFEEFNLGKTATHEIGHWLGLFHTFQGVFEGFICEGPGDYIADTPLQGVATSGCPASQDSCPNDPGLDPIHNYMDYSTDPCYEEFTPLQAKRMYSQWFTYRDIKPRGSWWS